MHGMIYGAQQTIKLIRLCVFPEEEEEGVKEEEEAGWQLEPSVPSSLTCSASAPLHVPPPRVTGVLFSVCTRVHCYC